MSSEQNAVPSEQPCGVCSGRGYVGTGIDEFPRANCTYCDGSGVATPPLPTPSGDALPELPDADAWLEGPDGAMPAAWEE